VADHGTVREFKDLAGRTVALPSRGQSFEIFLDKALERGGLTLNDVEVKVLPFPEMLAGLANNSVDAATELEPFIAQGEARGILARWKLGVEIYPGQQLATIFYGPSMTQSDSGLGNRFILAYARGLHAYNDAFGPKRSNWAEMVAILIKHTPVKDPALYEQMGWSYINPNCRLNVQTLTEDLEWYLRNGWVTERPDLTRVIDNSYCDYAVQQLGTYQP
jgi:NitT/TauT family transport system substrate-binding protein